MEYPIITEEDKGEYILKKIVLENGDQKVEIKMKEKPKKKKLENN